MTFGEAGLIEFFFGSTLSKSGAEEIQNYGKSWGSSRTVDVV